MIFQLDKKFSNVNFKKLALIFGIVFVFGILYGWVIFPGLFKMMLAKMVQLRPNSEMRSMWEAIPFYLGFKIYIFNVTNVKGIMKGEKPHLQEVGPYFFEEWKTKVDIVDDEIEDTATFYQKDTFMFRPDLSAPLTGNEMLTIPSPLLIGGAISLKRSRPPLLKLFKQAALFLFNETFITHRAMDIMFSGYLIDCSANEYTVKATCGAMELEGTTIAKYNETHLKFSFFGMKNATTFKHFKVHRGIKNIKDLGRVIQYQDEPEVETWNSDECNKLHGTDGTIFPPFGRQEDGIWAFVPDLCRSINTKFQKKSTYAGLPAERYTLNFGNSKIDESLHCYCNDAPDDCPPDGTMDLFQCMAAPIIASLPHFYDADPELAHKVDGLSPNKENHEVAIDFERTTGTPLKALNRLMLSLDMESVEEIEIMKDLPKIVFPLLWIEESIELNKTFTNKLKYQLFLPLKLSKAFQWLCLSVGFLGAAFSGYIAFQKNGESINTINEVTTVKQLPTLNNSSSQVDNSSENGNGTEAKKSQLNTILHGGRI